MGGVSLCMHMCVCFCVDAWLWGWACASLSLGVRGVSGHLCLGRGGVYMWEPVECVRVGGTVDSPPPLYGHLIRPVLAPFHLLRTLWV